MRTSDSRPSQLAQYSLVAIATVLSGCATVGTVQSRSEEINLVTSSYSNASELLNVLRAQEAEPINFVSLTAATGHITASAGIGLPTIYLGPEGQRVYQFGPNTLSGSEGTDFNVSVLDDPQSIAALSKPVDPATIGFLINQFYSRDLVLFLTISRITVQEPGSELVRNHYNELYDINGPEGGFAPDLSNFRDFYDQLTAYINQGLTVAVDQSFVPQATSSQSAPPTQSNPVSSGAGGPVRTSAQGSVRARPEGVAKFCFDSSLPKPAISTFQRISKPGSSTCPFQDELAMTAQNPDLAGALAVGAWRSRRNIVPKPFFLI